MAREAIRTALSGPIEPMHWLRSPREDEAVCGAPRRGRRTTRQKTLVTCPGCLHELVAGVEVLAQLLAEG